MEAEDDERVAADERQNQQKDRMKTVSCKNRSDLDQAIRFLCMPGAPKRWCQVRCGKITPAPGMRCRCVI